MAHAPLSARERDEIARALHVNPSVAWAEIARTVDRHSGTIAREVTRNGGRHTYQPITAQVCADTARRRPRQRRLAVDGDLRDRVTRELRAGRSPVAISFDLSADNNERVSPETIYQAVYHGALEVKARDCLRWRRPRRRHRQTRSTSTRTVLPSIADRPAIVNERREAGHWEIDTWWSCTCGALGSSAGTVLPMASPATV